jgi:flavin-dependent dehydrogenase
MLSCPKPIRGVGRDVVRTVVVAGGGIAGLTFAAAAKQAGFRPIVIERSQGPALKTPGGGLALWPSSQKVFHFKVVHVCCQK